MRVPQIEVPRYDHLALLLFCMVHKGVAPAMIAFLGGDLSVAPPIIAFLEGDLGTILGVT